MRKPLRQTMLENHAALCQMADLAGKPRPALPVSLPPEPKRRKVLPRTAASIPLEKEVQQSIIEFLLHHPRVALVVRHNSGAMETQTLNGHKYPIFFHKVYKKGIRIVDLDVTLKNGQRMVIECKRPGWHLKPHDQREQEQAAYIALHRSLGNKGCFACSIDDVINELSRGIHG